MSPSHIQKFRQAAFAYLFIGLLYESAVWAVWRNGLLPPGRGPVLVWLALGLVIVVLAVTLLWRVHNVWIPRAIFGLHSFRMPGLIGGAFFPAADAQIPTEFYLTALVAVVINLWMLARAGWDL